LEGGRGGGGWVDGHIRYSDLMIITSYYYIIKS
jgi:hypothetical protein